MLYAGGARKLRQLEYDHPELYNDTKSAQVEPKKRLQLNFIDYFEKVTYKRHSKTKNQESANRIKDAFQVF